MHPFVHRIEQRRRARHSQELGKGDPIQHAHEVGPHRATETCGKLGVAQGRRVRLALPQGLLEGQQGVGRLRPSRRDPDDREARIRRHVLERGPVNGEMALAGDRQGLAREKIGVRRRADVVDIAGDVGVEVGHGGGVRSLRGKMGQARLMRRMRQPVVMTVLSLSTTR